MIIVMMITTYGDINDDDDDDDDVDDDDEDEDEGCKLQMQSAGWQRLLHTSDDDWS